MRLEKKQRKQTTATIWAPFIKTALLKQLPKDCVAQLEAKEYLSVLLRVLLFQYCVSRDKPLCSPSVSHCPHLCPCKPSEQEETGCVHRENEEISSFVCSCADSEHCWLCTTAVSRVSTHGGDQCVYMKIQWRQQIQHDGRPRRKTVVACSCTCSSV